MAFIVFSTLVFVSIGKPVMVLIFAGALNGMILPITLLIMLLAVYKKQMRQSYKHPVWLAVSAAIVVVAMAYMSLSVIIKLAGQFF